MDVSRKIVPAVTWLDALAHQREDQDDRASKGERTWQKATV